MTTVKIERAFIHLRSHIYLYITGADLEGGVRGVRPPPPPLKFAKHMLYNVN